MKRFPISAILLLLTWCGIVFGVMAREFKLPFRGDMNDILLEYMWSINGQANADQVTEAMPAWDYQYPNPPMGARTAIEIATQFRRDYVPDLPGETWKIESLEPCTVDVNNAKWCWSVKFISRPQYRSDRFESLRVYVMPNGEVYYRSGEHLVGNQMTIEDSYPFGD